MLEKARSHHAFADRGSGSVSSRSWLPDRGADQQPSSSFSVASPPRLPPLPRASAADPGNADDFDKVLFRNLVEMVPLVESLMDKRPRPSFARRASMIYTPAPSNDRKSSATKTRKADQSVNSKIHGDAVVNGDDGCQADDPSIRVAAEELISLKEQVIDLQNKLSDKDEVLKSMETSMNEMKSTCMMVHELKRQLEEKDSTLKHAMSQLSSLKVQLADKQAALEKLEWVAKTSNQKVDKLQGELEIVEYEIGVFMMLLDELSRSNSHAPMDENITYFDNLDDLPNIDVDEDGMEQARRAYMDAIAAAKENPNEETLCAAVAARQTLQGFVLQ